MKKLILIVFLFTTWLIKAENSYLYKEFKIETDSQTVSVYNFESNNYGDFFQNIIDTIETLYSCNRIDCIYMGFTKGVNNYEITVFPENFKFIIKDVDYSCFYVDSTAIFFDSRKIDSFEIFSTLNYKYQLPISNFKDEVVNSCLYWENDTALYYKLFLLIFTLDKNGQLELTGQGEVNEPKIIKIEGLNQKNANIFQRIKFMFQRMYRKLFW